MKNKREIIDITGKIVQVNCLGCALIQGEINSPLESIYTSEYFDAHQDYEIPIPGFIIIASKRHIQSIDEFTEDEKNEFLEFMIKVRKALRKVLNISVVYLIQEEDTSHHFHFWMFPRYDWMEKEFGRKIQSVRPIMEYARENLKTDQNLKHITETNSKLKDYLN